MNMTLMDKLKNMGSYLIKVSCDNCGKISRLKIQKGITIKEFLAEKGAGCAYCGCDTIFHIPVGYNKHGDINREEWSKNV